MFFNILSKPGLHFLKKISSALPVPGAYLAGGTALALILGHRESIDLDWFSPVMFNTKAVAESLSKLGQLRISEVKKGTLHCFLDDIQVTWLYYPNPLLAELQTAPEIPGLSLASLLDIAVMKWAALSSRGSRKDFIDLFFIAQTGLELKELVPLLNKKFPAANINYYHMFKSLAFFDDAEHEPWPVMHRPVQWEEIKTFFRQQQELLLNECLG